MQSIKSFLRKNKNKVLYAPIHVGDNKSMVLPVIVVSRYNRSKTIVYVRDARTNTKKHFVTRVDFRQLLDEMPTQSSTTSLGVGLLGFAVATPCDCPEPPVTPVEPPVTPPVTPPATEEPVEVPEEPVDNPEPPKPTSPSITPEEEKKILELEYLKQKYEGKVIFFEVLHEKYGKVLKSGEVILLTRGYNDVGFNLYTNRGMVDLNGVLSIGSYDEKTYVVNNRTLTEKAFNKLPLLTRVVYRVKKFFDKL